MNATRLLIPFLAVVAFFGCATFEARKHFGDGKKAESAGDLDTAVTEYQKASSKAPKNTQYSETLTGARAAASKVHTDRARDFETKGKWAEAVSAWEAAIKVQPTDPVIKARAEIARLHTKRSEPIDFYEATKKLSNALPTDRAVARALGKAQDTAVRYYIRLAETYTDASATEEAFAAYEKAKRVDPKNEVFTSPMYKMTQAKRHEVLGDQKLKAGDEIGAYREYEKALALADLPGLKRKLSKAKRSAGSSIEQIEQARAFERLKQWEDAAELYTVILEGGDVPKETEAAARIARGKSAELRANRALVLAQRDKPDQALASLDLAIEHLDGQGEIIALIKKGIEALRNRDAGLADARFSEAAAKDADLPVVKAASATSLAAAKASFEEVKKRAASDPAGAMVRMAKLTPFKKKLKGFDATKKALLKKAFKELLTQAETRAEEGKVDEAIELFATALELANPPAKLKAPLLAGLTSLRTKDFATAESVFDRILTTDKRARLAKTGKRIASGRQLAQLRKEARDATSVDDAIRAASAYKKILELDPDDAGAKDALAGLRPTLIAQSVKAADEHKAAGRQGVAFIYYRRAIDLDPANPEANAGINALTFEVRDTPLAWVSPVLRGNKLGDACSGAEDGLRGKLILFLTKGRKLGAEFLQGTPTSKVDAGERSKPTVEVRAALEHCAVNAAGGNMVGTMQVRIGPEVLYQSRIEGKFDPSSLPKDEIEDGLDPEKVLDGVLGSGARSAFDVVRQNASKLASWRVVEARSQMRASDDEGVARVYAKLRMDQDKLTAQEQVALRELEQFILNRFR